MFEAIQYYQSLAVKFDSRILCVPGIIVIMIGLCIWLSGLRWRKVLGALAGGSFFAAIGLCVGIDSYQIIALVTLIGITIGVLVEKIMLGIFGIILTAVIVLAGVSGKMNTSSDLQNYPRWTQYETIGVIINIKQASDITAQTSSYILRQIISNIKCSSIISICAAGGAILFAGFIAFVMPRFFIAFVSSSLGAAVIFAGLLMLLFYSGSKPVNYFFNKSHLYSIIIFVMLIFGTMVQLALSPLAAESEKPVPEKNGDENE